MARLWYVVGALAILAILLGSTAHTVGEPSGATTTSAIASKVVITVNAYNIQQVAYLNKSVASYLRSGDTIDLVNTGGSITNITSWTNSLKTSLPNGTKYMLHVPYYQMNTTMPLLANLSNNSAKISMAAIDYEPYKNVPFNWSFSAAQGAFTDFAALAYKYGVKPFAYPTGRPLYEHALASYGWNYSQLMKTIHHLDVQTQHPAITNSTWFAALDELINQTKGSGQSLSEVTVQSSLNGSVPNSVSASVAVWDIQAAEKLGITHFYVWWSISGEKDLPKVLKGIGR